MIRLYALVFCFAFSNEVMNMGLLVWSSSQAQDSIAQTVKLVMWISAGYVAAIFLNIGTKFSRTQVLAFVTMFGALLLILPSFEMLWLLALFMRSLLGQQGYAKYSALLPSLCTPSELSDKSKNLQFAGTFGTAAAMVFGPLISNYAGIKGIVGLSLGLIVCTMGLGLTFRNADIKTERVSADPSLSIQKLKELFKGCGATSAMQFLTWTVFGMFFVIEIPLLKHRINPSASVVSFFLGLGLVTSMVTTKLIPSALLSKKPSLLYVGAAVSLGLFSIGYLNADGIVLLVGFATLLGVSNAVFNVSLYTKVQTCPEESQREVKFLLYRLLTELGILFGTIAVYVLESPYPQIFQRLTGFAFIILGLLGIVTWFAKGLVLERELGASVQSKSSAI